MGKAVSAALIVLAFAVVKDYSVKSFSGLPLVLFHSDVI